MYFEDPRNSLKNGIVTSGERGTVMCNLPHGLHVILHDENGTEVAQALFNGRNNRRVIDTETTDDGRWGVTLNVAKDFWDAVVKLGLPAVVNGNIYWVASLDKATDIAEDLKDAIATKTNPINPDRLVPNATAMAFE